MNPFVFVAISSAATVLIVIAAAWFHDGRRFGTRGASWVEVGIVLWAALVVTMALVFILPSDAFRWVSLVTLAAGPLILLARSREVFGAIRNDPRLVLRIAIVIATMALLAFSLAIPSSFR